jgi:hypothetical protein
MKAAGLPVKTIAKILGVGENQVERECREELTAGRELMIGRIANSLYRKALGSGRESVACAMFILKTQAGWRETNRHEHSGPDGAPILIVTGVDRD